MQAAWYEAQGAARDVLVVGSMRDPHPGPGEVRVRISASGINPGDLRKREDSFGLGMAYPRVIPHSDGAGIVDEVGSGVSATRIGQRVWCFGAQSYRPFGTAAQYTVVPERQAVPLPQKVAFEAGACLGIPALTAHRAVHAGGPVAGLDVLVQGGAGGVGTFVCGFARRAGARVVATVRSDADENAARHAGAHDVVRTDTLPKADIVSAVRRLAPGGVHHIVEVAFDTNIELDEQVLAIGGSIAAYATGNGRPVIPFWNLLFKNARLLLLGSDDFPIEQKLAAAGEVNDMLGHGWDGLRIDQTFALADIAAAHEHAESGPRGRVVLNV
jgi:NADPH2:quinone reductase